MEPWEAKIGYHVSTILSWYPEANSSTNTSSNGLLICCQLRSKPLPQLSDL